MTYKLIQIDPTDLPCGLTMPLPDGRIIGENQRIESIVSIEDAYKCAEILHKAMVSAAPTPDIPEKAITTIKFHSKGGGFIRLKNELGHLFDVTVPPEKVDVEKLKLEVISYLDTHVGFINFGVYHEKDECMLVIGHTIDHLAAAGYLREPLERIDGLEDALRAVTVNDEPSWSMLGIQVRGMSGHILTLIKAAKEYLKLTRP